MMYDYLRPLLFQLDAETVHELTFRATHLAQRFGSGIIESRFQFEHPDLQQELWDISFPNPVGLAAGFDKNGELLPFWETLGFGWAEVGSVTAHPSEGNTRPRLFRIPEDQALINRMGLNNAGAGVIHRNIQTQLPDLDRPVGINIAKTPQAALIGDAAIEDFRATFEHIAGSADYVTLNVSCPNTKDGKTFEEPDAFEDLIRAINQERQRMTPAPPILAKLSPPEKLPIPPDPKLDELIAIAQKEGIHGFIATNTASDRTGLTVAEERLQELGPGGLSGKPLASRSTALVRYLYNKTEGTMPIIGVGGIFSAHDAYTRIKAGASLVQVYSGLVYEGPGLIKTIKKGLLARLAEDGFDSISQAVGQDA